MAGGMGLIASGMAGGLVVLGAAGKQLGDYTEKASLADDAAKIQAQRDAVLEGYASAREGRQYGHAERLQQQSFGHTERLQEQSFAHSENLQYLGFDHAEQMQEAQQKFTKGENALNRTLQMDLEKSREAGQDRRHGASLAIQKAQLTLAQNHITLVPQADGSMIKMTPDGQVMGPLADPQTGGIYYGTRDVAASTKILMEGNIKQMTALESEIKTAVDPAEKTMLRGKIEFLQRANESLASGGKTPMPEQSKDIRYDKDGKAYVQGPDGKPVPYVAAAKDQPAKAVAPIQVQPSAPAPAGLISGASSPIGRVGDAVTGAATNAMEGVAGAAGRAKTMAAENDALRRKVLAKESLTPAERSRAISIGWIRQ